MYEELTKRFLSVEWDKNCLTKLNPNVTDDEIIPMLDNAVPAWTFKITHIVTTDPSNTIVGGTLFLPGRMIDGCGKDEWSAIRNIISKLTAKVNTQQGVQTEVPQTASEQPKITSKSVLQELEDKKQKTQQNTSQSFQSANNILNELIGSVTPQQEPEVVPFDSPEAQAQMQEFQNQVQHENSLKTPTPDEVNPNREIMSGRWLPVYGEKMRAWMNKHNVTSPEQLSSWINRYCGLDYDHFNPEWTDKFVAWTEALQESQTY